MQTRYAAAFASLLIAAFAIHAQEKKPVAAERIDDKTFIQMAASGGMKEVKLGTIAQTQAASAEVKAFGQQMVQDHTKANQALMTIVQQKGLSLPPQMVEKHQMAVDRLSKLNGEEFDREYMKHMVESHKESIAIFTAESENGQDPDLKAFATKTLPTLKMHLEMAQKHADASKDR